MCQQRYIPLWEIEANSLSQNSSSRLPNSSTALFVNSKAMSESSEISRWGWRSFSQRRRREGHSWERWLEKTPRNLKHHLSHKFSFLVMWPQYLQEIDIAVSLCQMIQLSTPLLHFLHLHLQGLQGRPNFGCCRLLLSCDQLLHWQVMSLEGVDDAGQDAPTVVLCISRLLLFHTQLCLSRKCSHEHKQSEVTFSSPGSVWESSAVSYISFFVPGDSAWISSACSSAPPSHRNAQFCNFLYV